MIIVGSVEVSWPSLDLRQLRPYHVSATGVLGRCQEAANVLVLVLIEISPLVEPFEQTISRVHLM